jgi:hypothetical protein
MNTTKEIKTNAVKILYRVKNNTGKVLHRAWSVCYNEDDDGYHIPVDQKMNKDIRFYTLTPVYKGNTLEVLIDGELIREVKL